MTNYLKLPTRTKDLIRVVVETPRGTAAKLSYDPKTKVFEYTRALPVGMIYPYDWGFIPSTIGDDGDPLDGLVIHEAATAPGVIIKCDLLGSLRVTQKDADGTVMRNDRYVFRPHKTDAASNAAAADGVPQDLRHEIEHFFQNSIQGTGKKIKLQGWQDADGARASISAGMKAFARHK